MARAIAGGNTHLLPVAKCIIKITAYNVAGKEENEKIFDISLEYLRIRHQSSLDHASITEA
jgi:hypothetical protein